MKCKICDKNFDTLYKTPRNLTCGHTFCEQCLKIYTNIDEINCPKCSKISPSKNLPICYAIYEMLELDQKVKNSDFCNLHQLEKTQFYCKDCRSAICQICFLENHREHNVHSVKEISFVEETKKDLEKNFNSLKEKCDYLYLIKNEIEKCEEFIEKMREKQLKKLDNIYDNVKINKENKIENYDKLIEINYNQQKEIIEKHQNKIIQKLELAQIYSKEIEDTIKNSGKYFNFLIK